MDLKGVDDVPRALALTMCALVLEPNEWIHRRVEQVSYLDHNAIHRRITVDFDVPRFPPSAGDSLYVPIAQFGKQKLVNFDIRDAGGTALTMLTAEQNDHLSTALLLALATLHGADQIDSITERYIPRLVRSTTDDERELAWERIFQPNTTVGQNMLERPGVVAVASDLLMNFILYLPVTAEEAGSRKIVKIAFDAPRAPVEVAGLPVRMGWRDAEDSFRVPLAGYCASYHFELEAPSEMEITQGAFLGTHDVRPVTDKLSTPTRRAHFNLARLDRGAGLVTVRLRARSQALVGGAALFSGMNALALLFVLLRLHGFLHHHGTDAVAAALVAIPGILIGYITRPSEHAMVASFLSDLRRVAFVSCVMSSAGALVLFGGYSESTLRLIFWSFFIIGLVASLALATSWAALRPKR